MATTRSTSTRSRSSTAKRAPRRRAASSTSKTRAQSLADDAKTAVRSARTRASRAAKKADSTTVSIAAGLIAGIVAAGVAIFMNRDRLRTAASTGSERLKKAADDLSTMAHERIDQARDNITRLRARGNGSGTPSTGESADTMSMTG